MAVPIAIPKLGLTMTDCTLLGWSKADGDRVSKGDILYTIETDKIASEVEAEASGVLRRVAEVDAQLTVGAVIGYLYESGEQAASGADAGPPDAVPEPAAPEAARRRIRVSPVARRIAAAAGIDPAGLTGSGPGGAILRRDVERAVAERRAEVPVPAPATPPDAVPPPPAVLPPAAEPVPPDAAPQRRPLAGMRRAIATRMMQSLQGSAQMTAFGRIDMAEAVRFRGQCLEAERDLGVRITYTDLMLKAAATVLTEMPQINASIVGDEIVTWGAVDIGLAVALDGGLHGGLIVPVIHDAGRLTLPEIARARLDLIAKARSGRLSREETEGGTFTLSNFGSYGGDFETPILNPPQSALLGIGRIAEEPAVRDGQIVIRPMMSISMTFDHRLIDGAVAGRFRARLRDLLERPALWLAALR